TAQGLAGRFWGWESSRRGGAAWPVMAAASQSRTPHAMLCLAGLWPRGCCGSESEAGSRFAGRLLTVLASCRKQGSRLLDFLVDASEAASRGQPPPSVLPAPQGAGRLPPWHGRCDGGSRMKYLDGHTHLSGSTSGENTADIVSTLEACDVDKAFVFAPLVDVRSWALEDEHLKDIRTHNDYCADICSG